MISLTLSMLLIGFAIGIFYSITPIRISQRFHKDRLGTAFGIYETIFGIGFALDPIFAGAVTEASSPNMPYVVMSFLALLIILWF